MRVSRELARVQILPLAIVQGFTGLGLIITASIDVTKAAWLLVAIVLYLIAIGYAIFVQTPLAKRIIALTTPPPGAPAPSGPPAGGPPPELMGDDHAGQARRHAPDRARGRDRLPDGDEALLSRDGPARPSSEAGGDTI